MGNNKQIHIYVSFNEMQLTDLTAKRSWTNSSYILSKKVIKSQPSNGTFFENICRLEILLWDSVDISEEEEDATITAVFAIFTIP